MTILYSTKSAADYLNLSPRTLEKWRCQGKGPKYLAGKKVKYRESDLDAYLESLVITPHLTVTEAPRRGRPRKK